MKNLVLTIITLFLGLNLASAQSADPAVTGATFVPNQINTGQTSVLTVSFVNTGSTIIPKSSIELTISTAYNYYKTNGTTAPTGPGSVFFNWTYTGVVGTSDIWKGTNKVAINAFDGGDILLTVTGNTVSAGFETTNINVQPVDSLSKFNDAPVNNNLQPQLKINQGCPPAPTLSATTKANICPLTTADLTTLQPAAAVGQTFEWHTVASNPTTSTFISSPSQAPAGTYYLYVKEICYSPASLPVTVTISVCTSPDITISIGQPLPLPIAAQTSFIPVTVANIGTAPTVGQITAVILIPVGTSFGTFPVNNNGWTCSTSGVIATCTSAAAIANGTNTTFSVPFIPTAAQVGNPLTILPAVVSGGGEPIANTGNNVSTSIITPNVAGSDLVPSFTFSSTTFVVGASKTVVINVNEIGNIPTNGTTVSVFIPYSTGFTYAFTSVPTSVTVVGIEIVNNPNWTMTPKPAGILLTSTTIIPANGRSRIALTVTANTAGAEANITANIIPNGGGETKSFNNIISLAQSIQK
jgi:hypothetical protein